MDIEARVRQFEDDLESRRYDDGWYVRQMRDCFDADLRSLLAERLPRLGSSALPPLLHLVEDQIAPADAKTLAALVALQLGDRGASVSLLCSQIAVGSAWSITAANALARAKVVAAAPLVSDLLERTDPRDSTAVDNLSKALSELGGQPSGRTRGRIASQAEPWVREAFQRDFT